ncbi:MAG: AI-2E family transporter [Candidatus Eremiobacteraeota bacterium]|nr:AI-2E family transporter [Candidatus Eremiobacteraeota bacterium]
MKPRPGGFWRAATDRRVTYVLKVLMVVVLACYVAGVLISILERISGVVYILIGAIFFAYLIYPVVHWLRRLAPRMPLALAIAIVYAVVGAVLVVVAALLLPKLGDEANAVMTNYPDLVNRAQEFINDPNDPVSSHLPPWIRHELGKIPGELVGWIRMHATETVSHVMPVIFGTFAIVATFVIIPMVTAYLLLDLDNLKAGLAAVVPPERWRATLSLLADFDAVVGGFIRGQMIVALSVGLLITIAMAILHVRYPLLLGLIAAIGDLIPYVGAVVAFIPAFLTALTNNGWVNALLVTGAFVLIYEAEGHLLAPNIVSKTVRLSPFAVMLALLVGGTLAGIVGVLIAVPVVGVLRVALLRVFPARGSNETRP